MCSDVRELLSKVEAHLDDGRRGERLRGGVHAAIIGAPNAGKSSLLNILCKNSTSMNNQYMCLFSYTVRHFMYTHTFSS